MFESHNNLIENPSVVVRELTRLYRADNRKSIFHRPKHSEEREGDFVRALDDVNFVAQKGDCIGVVGRNGSGKSTLMRLIAGNEEPDQGSVYVSATPTLLGIAAALQSRLSGMVNIRLGLLAQGVAREDIPALRDEIIEFADIGDAINRPLATYSSGMGARLKFAIATAIQREILLIDEALGAGDAAFTDRAYRRMNEFLDDAGTIFLVSHSAAQIRSICNRAIWMHEGQIIADGDVESVTLSYRKWTNFLAHKNFEKAAEVVAATIEEYSKPEIVLNSDNPDC